MLIYDGDCAFCTRSARWAEARLPVGIPVVPWQELPDLEMLGLTETDVREAAWWVDTDGTTHRGHAAIGRSVLAMRKWWSPLAWLMLVPPLSWLAAALYWVVARYRHRMPGGTAECRLDLRDEPETRAGAHGEAASASQAGPDSSASR